MSFQNTQTFLTMGTLSALACLALACDEVAPGLPEIDSAQASPLPPVFDHRRDEARPRVVVGEGEDEGAWRAAAGTPAVDFDAIGAVPVELAVTGEIWTPRAAELIEPGPSPFRFRDGEVCTFGSQDWGSLCVDDEGAGCLRDAHWSEAMPGGLVVGDRHKFVLTTAAAVADALPAGGEVAALSKSQDDPLPLNANQIAAEVAALQLNLVFARLGYLGSYDLGRVKVQGGLFDGWTVAAVADFANRLVGGEHALEAEVDFDGYVQLLDELQAINAAGQGCVAADYIRRR